MSTRVPCVSKTGGLLHLLFVERKLESSSNKFDAMSNFVTGVLIHLEVMEREAAIKKKHLSEIMEVYEQQLYVSMGEHNY